MEDRKYKDYQGRLSLLLSHPGIMKNMNKNIGKNEKEDPKKGYSDKAKQKIEKRLQLKNKINYIYQMNNLQNNNDQLVKDLVKNVDNQENDDKINDVIEKAITNQEDDFKAKLEAKRKKIKMNNSDMMDKMRLDKFNNNVFI